MTNQELPAELQLVSKYVKDTLSLPGAGTLAVDTKAMSVTGIICTPAIDADGDSVEPSGGKFDRHRANPILCLNHQVKALPIGRTQDPQGNYTVKLLDPQRLSHTAYFSQKNRLAADVFDLYAEGILRGWSISFIPLAADLMPMPQNGRKRGYHMKSWEMLEVSAVTLPNNPETLAARVAKGFHNDTAEILLPMFAPHLPAKRAMANGWTAPVTISAKELRMSDERELQAVMYTGDFAPEGWDAEHKYLDPNVSYPFKVVESSSFFGGAKCKQLEVKPYNEFDPADEGEVRDLGQGVKGLYFKRKAIANAVIGQLATNGAMTTNEVRKSVNDPGDEQPPVATDTTPPDSPLPSKADKMYGESRPHGCQKLMKMLELASEHTAVDHPEVKSLMMEMGRKAKACCEKCYPEQKMVYDPYADFGSDDSTGKPVTKANDSPPVAAKSIPTAKINPADLNALISAVESNRKALYRLTGQEV